MGTLVNVLLGLAIILAIPVVILAVTYSILKRKAGKPSTGGLPWKGILAALAIIAAVLAAWWLVSAVSWSDWSSGWNWLYTGYGIGGLALLFLLVWAFITIRKNGSVNLGWLLIPLGIAVALVVAVVGVNYASAFVYEATLGQARRTPSAAALAYSPAYSTPISWEVVSPIIAQCESRGRQFGPDGQPIRNPDPRSSAVGKFQILEDTHRADYERLGYDIVNSESDNEAFARWLYGRDGIRPWIADPDGWPCLTRAFAARGLPSPLGGQLASFVDLADTTRTAVIRPGQPAEAVMPVGWRMDWWGETAEFNTRVVWRGRDKVRVFTTAAGIAETEIRHRVYPCSPAIPC